MIPNPEKLARRTILIERDRIRHVYATEGFIRPHVLILSPNRVSLTALERPEIGQEGHFAVLRRYMECELSPGFCAAWMEAHETTRQDKIGPLGETTIIYLAAITHWGNACGRMKAQRINEQVTFGDIEWVDESHIQPVELLTLLPKGQSQMTPADVKDFGSYFHPRGTHPIWWVPFESAITVA